MDILIILAIAIVAGVILYFVEEGKKSIDQQKEEAFRKATYRGTNFSANGSIPPRKKR